MTRASSKLLVATSLLALPACSDYGLFGRNKDDPCSVPGACDETNEDTGDACEWDDLPATTVDTTTCTLPFGGWEARELWSMESLVSAVLVSRDTDGDGAVTGRDAPMLWTAPDGHQYQLYDGRNGQFVAETSLNSASITAVGILDGERGVEVYDDYERALWALDGSARPLAFPEPDSVDFACRGRDRHPTRALVDLDGDGFGEVLYYNMLFDHDLNFIGAPGGSQGDWTGDGDCTAAVADLDNDGRREVMTGGGIYRDGLSVQCLADGLDGWALPLDMDGDGLGEVVVTHVPEGVWVMSRDCEVVLRHDLGDLGDMQFTSPPSLAGPFLRPDRPAILVGAYGTRASDGARINAILLDHELKVRQVIVDGDPSAIAAADFDGDGVYELLLEVDRAGERHVSVVDARTWTERMKIPGTSPLPVDVDGDGFLEVLTYANGGTVAWNAADGEWGRAGRNWNMSGLTFNPAFIAPDGTLAPAPRDWRHMNLMNAQVNDGYRYAYGSDPVVTIDDVCTSDCESGVLHAWVRVGNAGSEPVEVPLLLRLYAQRGGEETLAKEIRVESVPSGKTTAGFHVRLIDASDITGLRAEMVPDGWVLDQCDTENDVAVWVGELCGG